MKTDMLVPNSASKVIVSVDGISNNEIYGKWKAVKTGKNNIFHSYLDLILKIDDYYNRTGMMAPSTIDRCFLKSINKEKNVFSEEETMDDMIFVNESGEKATFVIQVMFRQNSTWQGKVTWLESGKETQFRSTMELLKIMDEAVNKDELADAATD